MIEISLTAALILYSSIIGLLAVSIWIYSEVTVRRSYRVLEKQFLWRCVFCGYIYLDEGAEQVSMCPRCESYNSTKDKLARYVKTPPKPAKVVEDEDRGRNTSHRKRPHQRRRGPRKRR
ncbi:MAG TPA: hypothetical protein VMZ06_01550 [Candidatus Bathyarchaeia archaeon]|nr:hypothetical protein [Candidatus Bathyarchaeia archaeon]